MPKCYIGLYRNCKVYDNIVQSLNEMIADEKKREKKLQELQEQFLDVENWMKLQCSYCIKAHAEKRRRRFSGRFGVGVTI